MNNQKKSCCGNKKNHSCGHKKEIEIENYRGEVDKLNKIDKVGKVDIKNKEGVKVINQDVTKKTFNEGSKKNNQSTPKRQKDNHNKGAGRLRFVVGVQFEVTQKRYFFEAKRDVIYKKGDKVLVETARGIKIGVVFMEPKEISESKLVLPLKPILKKADKKEEALYEKQKEDAKKVFQICKKEIRHFNLDMKLVAAEYTIDKKKLIFYFTADGRVDFRELVKSLASQFKLRIELRQIGVRDEARILGDVGVCGRELCCRTFINKFDSVSIKMARDQGLVINPAKISGVCGRLLCCIKYENEQYVEELKKFPANQQRVETVEGPGRVTSVNPLNGYMYIDVQGKGVMKMYLEDLKSFNPKEAKKLQSKLTKEERKLKNLEEN